GTASTEAARWLSSFDRIAASRDGFRLLYGSPDAAALVHAGQPAVLTRAAAAGRAVSRTRSLPLLVLPAAGNADRRTVTALSTLNPVAVLLSDVSVRAVGPLLQGPDGVPVVRYRTSAADGGPGPEPSDTPVHLRQRFLADTWLEARHAQEGSTVGRVRLVTSAAQARSAGQAVQAPWLRTSTLSQLLRGQPTEWNQRYRYSAASRDRELSASQLAAATRMVESAQRYESLLVAPTQSGLSADAAVARTASTSFRRSVRAGRVFAEAQQAELDAVLEDGVTISVTRRVVTSARSGVFPVTVRNNLKPDPVDPNHNALRPTRLEFSSSNSQRLTVADLDVERLAAGEGFSANARVEAKTNGTVRVTAQLLTTTGERVGTPVSFDVRATQAGATGWIIAFAAGLVLVGTTAWRIRAVTRERSEAAAAEAAYGEPGPLSSAPPTDTPTREPRPEGAENAERLDV
ncbi:MAG: DUF6049 family protein, partial [Actinomycetes bacterium]